MNQIATGPEPTDIRKVVKGSLNYRQLLGVAIGEHGVNFNALQFLLRCLIDQLELRNVPIDLRCLSSAISKTAIEAAPALAGTEKLQLEEIGMRLAGGADEAIEDSSSPASDELNAIAESLALEPPAIRKSDASDKEIEQTVAKNMKTEQMAASEAVAPASASSANAEQNDDSASTDFTVSYSLEGELSVVDTKTETTTHADTEAHDEITYLENLRLTSTNPAFSQYVTTAAFQLRLELFEQDLKYMLEEKLRNTFDKLKDFVLLYTGQLANRNLIGGIATGDATEDELIVAPSEEQEPILQRSASSESLPSSKDSKDSLHRLSELRDRFNKFTTEDLSVIRYDISSLYGKVSELSRQVAHMQTASIIQEMNTLHQDVEELKTINRYKFDNQKMVVNKVDKNKGFIIENRSKLKQLHLEKADKADIEKQLATKAEFAQLQRKASLDDLLEVVLSVSHEIYEARKLTTDTEKNLIVYVDELEKKYGTRTWDDKLLELRRDMFDKIAEVRDECLQKLEGTTGCAASSMKVLNKNNCLSCGTCCTLKDSSKVKIPLGNAKAPRGIAPLVSMPVKTVRYSPDTVGYMQDRKMPSSGLKVVVTRNLCKKLIRPCLLRSPAPTVTLNGTSEHIERCSNI